MRRRLRRADRGVRSRRSFQAGAPVPVRRSRRDDFSGSGFSLSKAKRGFTNAPFSGTKVYSRIRVFCHTEGQNGPRKTRASAVYRRNGGGEPRFDRHAQTLRPDGTFTAELPGRGDELPLLRHPPDLAARYHPVHAESQHEPHRYPDAARERGHHAHRAEAH